MYIDPPYPKNKVNYFHNMQSWEEHQQLAKRLDNSKCKWILSSFDVPEVRELYSDESYHIIPVQAFSGMEKKKNGGKRVLNKEVLIMNFSPEGYPVYSKEQFGQLRLIAERDSTEK
jgi:site-specific DNA-adenine methylase